MKPQETRRLISITPIEVQPKPRIEVNDKRKRCRFNQRILDIDREVRKADRERVKKAS